MLTLTLEVLDTLPASTRHSLSILCSCPVMALAACQLNCSNKSLLMQLFTVREQLGEEAFDLADGCVELHPALRRLVQTDSFEHRCEPAVH